MAEVTLTQTRIRAGVWEGQLSGVTGEPALEVLHLQTPLPNLAVTPLDGPPGRFAVRLPIPVEVLSEGVQTFVFRDKGSGETLAHFTIVTGVALEEDIRAEVDLMRAELDMLKRAFRRHCLETTG